MDNRYSHVNRNKQQQSIQEQDSKVQRVNNYFLNNIEPYLNQEQPQQHKPNVPSSSNNYFLETLSPNEVEYHINRINSSVPFLYATTNHQKTSTITSAQFEIGTIDSFDDDPQSSVEVENSVSGDMNNQISDAMKILRSLTNDQETSSINRDSSLSSNCIANSSMDNVDQISAQFDQYNSYQYSIPTSSAISESYYGSNETDSALDEIDNLTSTINDERYSNHYANKLISSNKEEVKNEEQVMNGSQTEYESTNDHENVSNQLPYYVIYYDQTTSMPFGHFLVNPNDSSEVQQRSQSVIKQSTNSFNEQYYASIGDDDTINYTKQSTLTSIPLSSDNNGNLVPPQLRPSSSSSLPPQPAPPPPMSHTIAPPPPPIVLSSEASTYGRMNGTRKAFGTFTASGEKIRRPPNAFMIFAKDRRREILYSNRSLTNKEVSKVLGSEWRLLSPDVRTRYQQMSEEMRHEHQLKYPGYYYSPIEARRMKEERKMKRLGNNNNNGGIGGGSMGNESYHNST